MNIYECFNNFTLEIIYLSSAELEQYIPEFQSGELEIVETHDSSSFMEDIDVQTLH